MNVGTLYELLDRPARCDNFMICFTMHDRGESFIPTKWLINQIDNEVAICRWLEGGRFIGSGFCVAQLKLCLNGTIDDGRTYASSWMSVVFEDVNQDDESIKHYNLSRRRFEINWKRQRVDVFIDRIY